MIVSITQEHIDSGIPKSPEKCAIATAIGERLRPGYSVEVSGNYLSFWKGPKLVLRTAEVPDWMNFFVALFDNGRPVHPAELDVYIPDWAERLIFQDPVEMGLQIERESEREIQIPAPSKEEPLVAPPAKEEPEPVTV